MAGAVSKPLFFGDALFPHCCWKPLNEVQQGPFRVKISKEVASNGWKLLKPCTATGANAIRQFGDYYSSYMSLHKRLDYSLNSSYTVNGTSLSVNTIICGYWTGPDYEDGFGYVDALVQRIV